MFYTPIWDYEGYQLVTRPDTDNYYIAWCTPGTGRYRRKSTGTSDLDEARKRLIEFARRRSRPMSTEPHEVMIMDCLVDYVERKIRTKKRWSAERTALKHWTDFTEQEEIETVADLTLARQELYSEWRRGLLMKAVGRASNGTINREFDVMRACLRDAWKQGRLTHVPHVMSLPNPKPRQRVLTVDEIEALLDACTEPHLHLFVMLALHTLQRPGAIFELRTTQVDLDAGRIDFHRPDDLLTNKRRAVVPITATLRPHLVDAIANAVSGHIVEWDGKPIESVKTAFATACRHADLEDVTPYVLRHTGTTLLAAAGVPMRQIAGMLGHTTTHTTEYHYAKHRPDYLSEASGALDEMFGRRGEPQSENGTVLRFSGSPARSAA